MEFPSRWKFFRDLVKHAFHSAFEAGHRMHSLLVFLGGALLVFWAIHLDEYKLAIALPFLILVAAFFVALFNRAYSLCQDEFEKRIKIENELAEPESRKSVYEHAEKQFEGLELEEKEIVRQLLVKERLGLQEIGQISEQKCLPFVDSNRLKLKTDFLRWDADSRSFSIDPAYRGALEEILAPPIPHVSAFAEIERIIPDLLSVLRQRLRDNPLIRDIIVLEKKTIAYNWPDEHLFFSAEEYPGIWSKIRILENQGLVSEVKDRFAYRISEKLAAYLRHRP